MQVKGAWQDPALSLRDRANAKQQQLLAEREMTRNEYNTLDVRLQYLKAHIDNLTFLIHNLDELIDGILGQAVPDEPNKDTTP